MTDHFASHSVGVAAPALSAFAISPSDSADLQDPIRMVTIGTTGGIISFISSRTGQSSTTGPLPVGNYPLFARRILATGTTAQGLTGWV